jgi:bifunctional UDP-N-acetylglucosamine pyrophosphorylase / glucosamine-1-phosphate N-acetyltransferase
MEVSVIRLNTLPLEAMPVEFRPDTYFDFSANPFSHESLFLDAKVRTVVDAVTSIQPYVAEWLTETMPHIETQQPTTALTDPEVRAFPCFGRLRVVLENGARYIPEAVFGIDETAAPHTLHLAAGACMAGVINMENGGVYIGEGSKIDRGATIIGPAIIGANTQIRTGAYVRENVILGDNCCFRGEAKNAVFMDHAVFPHPCYVGDSLCGFSSHFGNQATAANFGLLEGARPVAQQRNIHISLQGESYDLGVKKLGIILGDYCQIGCNAVSDPATFLAPYTMVYPLTRLNKGFYGPNIIIKNKPLQAGIIEIAPLESLGQCAKHGGSN